MKTIRSIVLLLILAAFPVSGATGAKDATGMRPKFPDDFLKKLRAKGVDELRKKAVQGDKDAQRKLGDLYYRTQYFPSKAMSLEALKWYRMAAAQGDAAAQCAVVRAYRAGRAWQTVGALEALDLARKSCSQGHVEAYVLLGELLMYEFGPDTYKEGLTWVRKGAAENEKEALATMGLIYWEGFFGVPKDKQKAIEWMLKAAEKGSRGALANLSYLYEHGDGRKQDLAEAYKWLALAHPDDSFLTGLRIDLKNKLTPAQIKEGQRRALEFQSQHGTFSESRIE